MKLDLTPRERNELIFSLVYAQMFAHGTTGHNQMMLLAKIAQWAGIDIEPAIDENTGGHVYRLTGTGEI